LGGGEAEGGGGYGRPSSEAEPHATPPRSCEAPKLSKKKLKQKQNKKHHAVPTLPQSDHKKKTTQTELLQLSLLNHNVKHNLWQGYKIYVIKK
jgi:hypothetical protein